MLRLTVSAVRGLSVRTLRQLIDRFRCFLFRIDRRMSVRSFINNRSVHVSTRGCSSPVGNQCVLGTILERVPRRWRPLDFEKQSPSTRNTPKRNSRQFHPRMLFARANMIRVDECSFTRGTGTEIHRLRSKRRSVKYDKRKWKKRYTDTAVRAVRAVTAVTVEQP